MPRPDGPATIRRARPDDAAALSALERQAVLRLADVDVALDREGDWFAATRLMEDVIVLVGEVDGELAGVTAGARHQAIVGGEERWMLYTHHARIAPQFQGTGVALQLSYALFEAFRPHGFDSAYWYIAKDNARSQAFAKRSPNKWSCGPEFATLDTAPCAGPPAGRPATPDDAAALADLCNATHAGMEFHFPYTAASLAARLTRDPSQYTWADVLLGRGAAVGMVTGALRVTMTVDGEVVYDAREGSVLDIACAPGAEAELEALLRASCARLHAQGIGAVTVFTNPASPTRDVIHALAAEPPATFDMWTPTLVEPDGAASRGVFVDPVYF